MSLAERRFSLIGAHVYSSRTRWCLFSLLAPRFCLGDSVEDYVAGIANWEITCVKKIHILPKSPITLCGPGIYMATREKKKIKSLAIISHYRKYLLPTDSVDRTIMSLAPWSSSREEKIFVHPENPSKIFAIIDWQFIEIAPLFNQFRQPYFLEYEEESTQGLERPQLPENYDHLDDASRKKAMSIHLSQMLSTMYRLLLRNRVLLLYRTWEYQRFDLLIA